jgi:hypothetical protein
MLLPEFFAGELCTLGQRGQLCPGDLVVDASAEAAVSAGDNVFAAGDVRKADKSIGNKTAAARCELECLAIRPTVTVLLFQGSEGAKLRVSLLRCLSGSLRTVTQSLSTNPEIQTDIYQAPCRSKDLRSAAMREDDEVTPRCTVLSARDG